MIARAPTLRPEALPVSEAEPRRSGAFGWGGSLILHGAIVFLATVVLEPPDTGFELDLPGDVELGFTQDIEVEEPAGDPLAAEEAPEAAPTPAEEPAGALVGVEPAPARPRRPRRERPPSEAEGEAGLEGQGRPVAFLPRGAQLAMRIDMDRIRSSPVGDELREVLALVPEWRALLGGSGVDPVGDLSRLLVATPNLSRDRLVVAGRLADGAPATREIAERTASARGEAPSWEDVSGVPTLAWPGSDGVDRRLAVLTDRHFVVSRPEDLARVLAIAASRRGRRAARPADALLSMEEGEGLSVEVEGASVFVRRSPCVVPERLRLGLVESEGGVEIRLRARFETHAVAEEAGACLDRIASEAARNVIVNLYGLGGPLERIEASTEAEEMTLATRMTYGEIRTIFGLLRGFLGARARGAAPAPPPPPPPPSPFE